MIIEITVGVIIIVGLFFLYLNWKEKLKLNKLRREYDESGDKSKRRVAAVKTSKPADVGNEQFEGRILLPASAIAESGINQTIIGTAESEESSK